MSTTLPPPHTLRGGPIISTSTMVGNRGCLRPITSGLRYCICSRSLHSSSSAAVSSLWACALIFCARRECFNTTLTTSYSPCTGSSWCFSSWCHLSPRQLRKLSDPDDDQRARDLAFPRINLLSWYIYIVGGIFAVTAIVEGGVDTGWTFYAPFSSTYSNTHVILAAIGVFISGFSSILTGLNFIVTIHKMRAPGMTWSRLPLFVWGHYATSVIQVLGTPVIAITLVLLGLERILKAGIFDPNLGGDPVLFQHLFWFYSHPAVYIMILPGMAVMSEIIACFSRKAIFGYNFVAFSSIAIAVLGFPGCGGIICSSPDNPCVCEHGFSRSSVFWWRFLRR